VNCETCKEDLTGLDLEYHYGRNHSGEPSLSEFKLSLRESNKTIGVLRRDLDLNGMICEAMQRAIRGESLSDFEESFGPVREALDLRASLIAERELNNEAKRI
jgi:hypothetical protein